MNKEGAIGLLLIGLMLGGIFLLVRRPRTALTLSRASVPAQTHNPGNHIKLMPLEAEPRRYQNKETRSIEYNEDNLPIKIVISRDFAIT